MKKLDVLSQRILTFSIGISAILISLSLFVLSLNTINESKAGINDESIVWNSQKMLPGSISDVKADSLEVGNGTDEVRAIHAFGIGIREGTLYFGILYNNNSIGLHKTDADGEDVLLW